MCARRVIARGISLDEEQTDYIKSIVEKVFDDTNYNKPEIREEFKGNVRKKINRYFNNKLRQKPMVLPIVMEK